jgi:hypothetical protein
VGVDMSDSFHYKDLHSFTNIFGAPIEEPKISNEELEEQIKVLSEKIKDIEMKLSGRYGILHIPTKEEIIQVTKEQVIAEYKLMNQRHHG